jgi:hypothetical protein
MLSREHSMHQAWQADDYLILFDEQESATYSAAYEIEKYLPGHTIVALKGWDDFIVLTPAGALMTVPTVPMDAQYLAPFTIRVDPDQLVPDERFRGKVKWYKSPLVFGGDPQDPANMVWVPLEAHAEMVRFWNNTYRRTKG